MKNISFYLVLFCALNGIAQKAITRSFTDPAIKSVVIDSDYVFETNVRTAPIASISVKAKIEGEYYSETLLKTHVSEGILHITTGKTPNFVQHNDKLSAHKVLSIVLEIMMPSQLDFTLQSALSQLHISGAFRDVQIDLSRGGVKAEKFSFRESNINTLNGSINASVFEAKPSLFSRNGKVFLDPLIEGNASLIARSVHGDIHINRVQ